MSTTESPQYEPFAGNAQDEEQSTLPGLDSEVHAVVCEKCGNEGQIELPPDKYADQSWACSACEHYHVVLGYRPPPPPPAQPLRWSDQGQEWIKDDGYVFVEERNEWVRHEEAPNESS